MNFVLVVALFALAVALSVSATSLRVTEQRVGAACCDDSCKSAICVPPWVSICSRCDDAKMEKVEVNQYLSSVASNDPKPNPREDCCQNKCKTAICVPPFVFVCAGCNEEVSEPAVPKAAPVEAVDVPYKHCCDKSCKTQLCVPPFVAICSGCKDQMTNPLLDIA